LGHTPLSLGPVIVNCINSGATILTESYLKKKKLQIRTIIGLIFIFAGTYLVCTSK
jgi:drug/metabolite transporter (DMT)-like permease